LRTLLRSERVLATMASGTTILSFISLPLNGSNVLPPAGAVDNRRLVADPLLAVQQLEKFRTQFHDARSCPKAI
jgi:hypothetical protein